MNWGRLYTLATIGLVLWLAWAGCKRPPSSEDRFFDSDGVRIRYQVFGEGPPVVLIHAFGEQLERWHSSGLTRAMSRDFRVVVFDVRGHGRSDKPTDPQSYGRKLSVDVINLMDHIGAVRAYIVGYSMGALIALDVAVKSPERVLAIVLGGAGVPAPGARGEFDRHADVLNNVREGDRGGQRALAALLRALDVVPDADVRKIKVPVAALIGANDPFIPSVQRLSRLLPSAEVSVIPAADHAGVRDHPVFARTLLAFLRRHNDTASSGK